jgi:phage shock protein E
MKRRRWILALVALGTGGAALAHPGGTLVRVPAGSSPAGTYRQVSPQELRTQLASKDFTLINVHIPYGGEIAGTDRFLPFDRVAGDTALPRDKNAELVVYCRSGPMSRVAAQALVRLGYTNVRELRGGLNAWTAAGYTLINRPPGTESRAGALTRPPSAPAPPERR